ncbi:MAG TPA: hypothetical protein VGL46_15045 [Pseudonocardiaceae bacterium]|jgi:hypothetical protein
MTPAPRRQPAVRLEVGEKFADRVVTAVRVGEGSRPSNASGSLPPKKAKNPRIREAQLRRLPLARSAFASVSAWAASGSS